MEHPKVKKARLAISRVNSLSYTLRCIQEQVAEAKRELAQALREMLKSGEPDQPWAAHWRNNLEGFDETQLLTTKGKTP